MSRLYEIEAPDEPVLTLEELKAHLVVDFSDHDALILAIGVAVEKHLDGAEGWLGRALVSQTWELRLDDFCSSAIRIPMPPLIEVESIKYYDTNDALQTLPTSVYEVVGVRGKQPAEVSLRYAMSWPDVSDRREAVLIRFRCGYLDTVYSPAEGEVPGPIKQALLLMAGTLYMQRETISIGNIVSKIPFAAEALLGPYEVAFFG